MNVSSRRNEIDIIALDKGTLVGVEVKTRINPWVAPELVPDNHKMLKISEGLKSYCRSNYFFPERVRIDIVGIEIQSIRKYQIIWLQGDQQRL